MTGKITESIGAFAENVREGLGPVCEGIGAAVLITTSIISLAALFDSADGGGSDEWQRDFDEADSEKDHALNTINDCRKSIQSNREIITKYRYQQFCPDALKVIDDGIACFERLLDAKLYDEALHSAQEAAETARNYSNAVLLSEKAWTNRINLWKAVRHMVNDKIQQLNSNKSTLRLPLGEEIPFQLNKWADENEIKEIEQAISADEPPQDWTLEQLQTYVQNVVDRLNQIITEAAEYCIHTYHREQRSRDMIITFKKRGWKYQGFRYENNDPKRDMTLHFNSVTEDKLKAVFGLDGGLKLVLSAKSNNTDIKRTIVTNLVGVLQENGISTEQLDWD